MVFGLFIMANRESIIVFSLLCLLLHAAGAQEIHTYMYETLTTTDWETLETIPWIADSLPKISDDKLSYEEVDLIDSLNRRTAIRLRR